MRDPHSAAFAAVRERLLSLTDEDRRRLTVLLGAYMTSSEAGPAPDLLAACEAVFRLPRQEQARLVAWFRRYVNRWGQVPQLSSQQASRPSAPWDRKHEGRTGERR